MGRVAAALLIAVFLTAAPAAGQSTSRPGPWTFDIRGVTSPVPQAPAFYPRLETTALVPARGFGLDLGAHVYLFNLGAARVGVGADLFYVKARTKPPEPAPPTETATPTPAPPAAPGQAVQLDLRTLAPQVSLNFGSREGWSYLSAGFGRADVITQTSEVNPARHQTSSLNAINVGGGARWFFKSHLAFGFDVRVHKISAGIAGPLETPAGQVPPADVPSPGMRVLTVAVGVSIR